MADSYNFELTFIRPILATNPSDPNILDTHILERQRKLILEKGDLNVEINKYLGQLPIAQERGEEDVNALIDKLENLMGISLTSEERQMAARGELEALKESFKELSLKGTTVFFWNKDKKLPMIGDHMIYGYMKAAAEAISRTTARKAGTIFGSASWTQSIINQHVRCPQRYITFDKDVKRNEDGTVQYLQRSLRAMTAQGPRVSLAKSEVVDEGAKLNFDLNVFPGSPLQEEHLEKIFDYGVFTGIGQWRSAGFGSFNYVMKKNKPKK